MSKISLKHSGGNVVSLNSPTNAPSAADVAFKLPNADGSAGQFMKTDGSGNLAFAAAGGGGKILQVKNTLKVDHFTTTSTSFVDITGLSIDITATSSSNKFYISCIVFANCQDSAVLRLVKDGTVIAAGTAGSGANKQGFAFVRNNSTSSGASYGIAFLDTAGDTNSHTYKVQGLSENGSSYTLGINRRMFGTGFGLSSSISAMEVAA